MTTKSIFKSLIIALTFFTLILFISYISYSFYFSNKEEFDTNIIMNKSDAFCESNKGSSGSLDNSCKKLSKKNCTSTSCCVWTSDNMCLAGSENGPTFNSDSNGKSKTLDYYYFKDKCFGEKCSNV